MEIVKHPNPLLTTVSEDCNMEDLVELNQLIIDMKKVAIEHNALGLSAIQIGVPQRVFIFGADSKYEVAINPRIVNIDTEEELGIEGCLSIPNFFVKIKRPKAVRLRYINDHMVTVTKVYEGLTARCIFHEFDHLNGLTIYAKADKFHKDQALRRQLKLNRKRVKDI